MSWNCLSLHLPVEGCAQWKVPLFKGLFTWSGGPLSSGVSFFCFHSLGDTKQKRLTPLDRGPPVHVNRVLINSQMTNKIVHEIAHVTEFLETKTECSTKPKLFHCNVFALVQGGNNSTCLVLYTLRYFQVLYPWLIFLRKPGY